MASDSEGKCKTSWPELVGVKGEEAAKTIKRENTKLNDVIVLRDGTPVTKDLRNDRVWVWVDENEVVVRAPRVG